MDREALRLHSQKGYICHQCKIIVPRLTTLIIELVFIFDENFPTLDERQIYIGIVKDNKEILFEK